MSIRKANLSLLAILLCYQAFCQIYPSNFMNNGCYYTYNGMVYSNSNSIHCKGNNYHLIFEDNFDGTALDTSVWQTYYPWGRALPNNNSGTGFSFEYMSDSNVVVHDGYIHFITKIEPGIRDMYNNPGTWQAPNFVYFKYTSGMIYSKINFKAGKFEIRAKIPYVDATWPAFWLYGHCAQEIDVFEFQCGSSTSDANFDSGNMIMTYHRKNDCTLPKGDQCDNGLTKTTGIILSNDFHIYTLEWDENKIIWKLDGEMVREVYRIWSISPPSPIGPMFGNATPIKNCNELVPSSAYTTFNTFPSEQNPMNIILGTGISMDGRGNFPTEFIVDYVKAYSVSDTLEADSTNIEFVNIYPNPSTNNFSISQSAINNSITEIILYNYLGEEVMDKVNLKTNLFASDLNNLWSGVYFVKIICEHTIYYKKIVIN